MYVGLRGVGKTVLLKEVSSRLSQVGWYAPYLEMRRNLPVDQALAEVAERFARLLPASGKLKRQVGKLLHRGGGLQVLGSGASMGPGRTPASYADLSHVLEALARAAREDGVGVALLVDELQSLSKTNLGALIHLVQDLPPTACPSPSSARACPTSPPIFPRQPRTGSVSATANRQPGRTGVPCRGRRTGAGRGCNLGRRCPGRSRGGRPRVPYFLQLYAFESWEVAGRHEKLARVSLDSVKVALPIVERQIETGIYAARFHQATEAERRYLFAMLDLMAAEGVGQVRSGDVARAMNRELSAVSPTWDNLIRKGVIHSPEHGALAFSIPGFREYVERRRLDEGA